MKEWGAVRAPLLLHVMKSLWYHFPRWLSWFCRTFWSGTQAKCWRGAQICGSVLVAWTWGVRSEGGPISFNKTKVGPGLAGFLPTANILYRTATRRAIIWRFRAFSGFQIRNWILIKPYYYIPSNVGKYFEGLAIGNFVTHVLLFCMERQFRWVKK